jgi:hypothetical protein
MDPLTALSTAGTAIQFVDFALKIFTTGHQLYKSPTGSLSAHEELKCVARDLSGLAKRLSHAARSHGAPRPSQADAALADLCGKCETIAQDLMEHLRALKIQGKKAPIKSFRPTLKATWDQKDLITLVQRLQLLRNSLETWLLMDVR